MKRDSLRLTMCVNTISTVKYPYIPGLFMMRESEPLLNALNFLENLFDLLLIDAHGTIHPRLCGLASYIGFLINKPTIGIGKKLLCGSVRDDQFIEINGIVAGFRLKKENKKPIYISIGHRISLETATQIVENMIRPNEWIPEPLRIADRLSKRIARCF